jgi:hypothetical protein
MALRILMLEEEMRVIVVVYVLTETVRSEQARSSNPAQQLHTFFVMFPCPNETQIMTGTT